ncbi:hypothetical protein FRB98_001571 [Tulasnella sp. 332]|nr:hypothetical protein FRB98_001571 [Tulasnella sp. 332]
MVLQSPHARRGKDDELFQYARLVDDDEGVELERDVTGTVEKIKGDGPRSSGGSNAKTLKEKAKKIFSMGLFKGRKSDKVSLLDDGHRFEDVPSKSSPKIKGGSSGLVKPKSDTVLFVDGSGQQPSMGKIKAGAKEEEKVKLVDHMVLTKGENQKEYDRLQEEKRRQELIDAIENAGIV